MGAVIKFIGAPPPLVSAGHDGFDPYGKYPFDSIFVQAFRYGNTLENQYVEFWLPYQEVLSWHEVEVQRSGFLWHDRLRDVAPAYMKLVKPVWLSKFGFTDTEPKSLFEDQATVFAELPGSPMQDSLENLWLSRKWQGIIDFHTRKRGWMPAATFKNYDSRRFERDSTLIARIKSKRGSSCQICGYSFKKVDGTDYSELHHLDALADGGLDIDANCLILCANCHRQFHYGNVHILTHTHTVLIVKIDGITHSCRL